MMVHVYVLLQCNYSSLHIYIYINMHVLLFINVIRTYLLMLKTRKKDHGVQKLQQQQWHHQVQQRQHHINKLHPCHHQQPIIINQRKEN